MPTYSYRCTECSTAFDIHQEFSDDSLTVCPTCGGKLRKVYGAVGVSFTGSGFYRNDSRAPEKGQGKGESSGSASGDSSSSSSGGSSGGSSSDSSSSPAPASAPASSSPAPSSPSPSSTPTKKD